MPSEQVGADVVFTVAPKLKLRETIRSICSRELDNSICSESMDGKISGAEGNRVGHEVASGGTERRQVFQQCVITD